MITFFFKIQVKIGSQTIRKEMYKVLNISDAEYREIKFLKKK